MSTVSGFDRGTARNCSRRGSVRPPTLFSLIVLSLTVGLGAQGVLPSGAATATKGAWKATGSLQVARAEHTAATLGGPACRGPSPPGYCGKVLVAGGSTFDEGKDFVRTKSAELYDPASGSWTATGRLAFARASHTATPLNGPACEGGSPPSHCGKILVAGGFAANGRGLSSAELYDPATGTWSLTGPLTQARGFHTATLLENGTVLVVGGRSTTLVEDALSSSELYDPASGTWSPAGPLAEGRYSHAATKLADGIVLVTGGKADVDGDPATGAEPTGSAEVYDPITKLWRPTGSLLIERADHEATLLDNGSVFVTGGFDRSGLGRRSAELYDPGRGAWTPVASMAVGRYAHAALVLPGNRVIVIGGIATTALDAVEIYDLAAGKWSYTGFLSTSRYRHTATLFSGPGCAANCGKVLVAGGVRGIAERKAVKPAELYNPEAEPVPGRVMDLEAAALVGEQRVRLTFSATGTNGKAPPPASRYVIKQSRKPITAQSFDKAQSLCTEEEGVCTYSPQKVGDDLTLRVRGVRSGTIYYYALRAQHESGKLGPISNIVKIKTPAVPPGRVNDLSARALSRSKIRLTFSAVGSDGRKEPPARRYVIKQSRAPITNDRRFGRARSVCPRKGVCRFAPSGVGDKIRFTVTGLRPRTTYHYAVKARDEGGTLGRISSSAAGRTKKR